MTKTTCNDCFIHCGRCGLDVECERGLKFPLVPAKDIEAKKP